MTHEAGCVAGTCSPVLQPEARWGDIWGMGWLNFHGKLVREVQTADSKEVHWQALDIHNYSISSICAQVHAQVAEQGSVG